MAKHYIGVDCTAEVHYEAIVVVDTEETDMEKIKDAAFDEAVKTLRKSDGYLTNIHHYDIDNSDLQWVVEGISFNTYDDGYTPDFFCKLEVENS